MLGYITKSIFNYIKTLLPSKDRPLLEPVPNVMSFKGTDAEYYDITRPTFALNHWELSKTTFYTLNIESKKYIQVPDSVMIFENTHIKPEKTPIIYNNLPMVITRPLNMYTFEEETGEFIPYKNKIKISLNL